VDGDSRICIIAESLGAKASKDVELLFREVVGDCIIRFAFRTLDFLAAMALAI